MRVEQLTDDEHQILTQVRNIARLAASSEWQTKVASVNHGLSFVEHILYEADMVLDDGDVEAARSCIREASGAIQNLLPG